MKVFSHCASRHTQSFCEHRDQLCKTTAIHIVIVCQFCGIVKASMGLHHDTIAEFVLNNKYTTFLYFVFEKSKSFRRRNRHGIMNNAYKIK